MRPVLPKKLQHVKNKRIDVCLVHAHKGWREESILEQFKAARLEKEKLGAIWIYAKGAAAQKNTIINHCMPCSPVPGEMKSKEQQRGKNQLVKFFSWF